MRLLILILALHGFHVANAKTDINMFQDYTIAAGLSPVVIVTGDIIASGKVVRMKRFGCAIIDTIGNLAEGYVAVQWGSGGSWTTIRACKQIFEFTEINREFTGDGAKRFRIVGLNGSTLGTRIISYWFEARVGD